MSDKMTVVSKKDGRIRYIIEDNTVIDVTKCRHIFGWVFDEENQYGYFGPCVHCNLYSDELEQGK